MSNISSMNIDCHLGIKRANAQSYAIVLKSPSVGSLQLQLDKTSEVIDNHDSLCLINAMSTKL